MLHLSEYNAKKLIIKNNEYIKNNQMECKILQLGMKMLKEIYRIKNKGSNAARVRKLEKTDNDV